MEQASSAKDTFPSEQPSTQYYVLDNPTEFRMLEKVFAPDTFVVETAEGKTPVFTVKGKVISFEGEKTMYDTQGAKVFKMTENITSTLQYMYLFDYRKKAVYTVRKKGFLPGRGRGTVLVWEGKEDKGEPIVQMQSNFSRSQVKITEVASGKELASVERSLFGARRVLAGADSYKIRVNAGAELAFIMMLVVCSDEHYTDFNR